MLKVDGSWDGPTPECESGEGADVRPLRPGAGMLQTTETPVPKRRTPPFRRKPITKEVVEEGQNGIVKENKKRLQFSTYTFI